MTLNGVMAVILRYLAEFDSFGASIVKVIVVRPIQSATFNNSPTIGSFTTRISLFEMPNSTNFYIFSTRLPTSSSLINLARKFSFIAFLLPFLGTFASAVEVMGLFDKV